MRFVLCDKWIQQLHLKNTFSIFKIGFPREFLNFLLVESFSRKYSQPANPDPFRRIYLWFSSLRMRGLYARAGSIFIPFIPSQSIEAYKRSQGQSERRDTLICQCSSCVVCLYRSCIRECRFFAPVSFRPSAFSAQPLDVEKYTGVEGREEERERQNEKEREKETNKSSLRFRFGVLQHVAGCHDTYPPVFRPLRNITILWSFLHLMAMIVLKAVFLEKRNHVPRVNVKLDLSRRK